MITNNFNKGDIIRYKPIPECIGMIIGKNISYKDNKETIYCYTVLWIGKAERWRTKPNCTPIVHYLNATLERI